MTSAGVVSVDSVAATSPDISVTGWTFPMSASRLTVACCMFVLVAGWASPSWLEFRPQAHCTVPAPKTSAPLEARYRVR